MRTLLRESGPDAKPGTWRPAVSKGEILPIVVCPGCSTKIVMSRHGDLDNENNRDYPIGCGCPKCGWSEGIILDGWPIAKDDLVRRVAQSEREEAKKDIDHLEQLMDRIPTQDAKDRARRIIELARIGFDVKYQKRN